MRFVVSQEFIRQKGVKQMGERYFARMPIWVQDAVRPGATVVIAYSSEGVERTIRGARIKRGKNVFDFIFRSDIGAGYQDFFGWLLKQVIDNDQVLSHLFMNHARSVMVPGISNDLVVTTLFRHLAWYFMAPGQLHDWSQERFDLCKKIADDLMSVGLPQGTLQ